MDHTQNKILNKTKATTKTNEEEKRPPGRPPGKKTNIRREGFVKKPDVISNNMGEVIFQMMYYDPISFKSLFNTFKKYNTSKIEFYFSKEKTYICSKDHNSEVIIFCEIHGKNMNKYYCKEPVKMLFSAITIFKTFDGIPTIYDNINFVIFDKFKKSKLLIIFSNKDQMSQYTIDILSTECEMITDEKIKEYSEQEINYPINFTIKLKEMKPKISELSHISKHIGIEQCLKKTSDGVEKIIIFKCISDDKRLVNRSTFMNKDCFNLNSTFDEPYFYIPIPIKNIKPFIVSLTKNKGIFYLKSDSQLVIKSLIDSEVDMYKKDIPDSEFCYIKIIANILNTEQN